jgi:site-specific DNA recombinase
VTAMRTLIYARYSSALQDKRSIEDQLRVCRDHAEREGWTILDVFTDFETSGRVYERPGLQSMLTRVDAGGVDQVLAEALDRIARDEVDAPRIRRRVEHAGARIFTLSQGHVNELHTALQGAMDALQLKELAAKVRRGQRGNAAKGRATGGRAYGYRVANRLLPDGTLIRGLTEIVEQEAEIVRRIYREFLGGKSPLAICADLNREGVPSPTGGRWRVSTINGDRIRRNGILQNDLYAGRQVYNKTHRAYHPETRKRVIRSNPREKWLVTEVPHLRIVDEESWRAVEQHRERIEGVPCHSQKRAKRLLSGLGRCAVCGSGWIVVQKDRWGCSAHRDGRGCSNNRQIMNGEYERRVLAGMQSQLFEPGAVKRFVASYHKAFAAEVRERGADAARLRRALEESEGRVANFVAAIGAGADVAEVRTALQAAKAEAEESRRALAALDAPAPIPLHPGIAEKYRREFDQVLAALHQDDDSRRGAIAAIAQLIERIEVRPAETGRGVAIDVVGRLANLIALAAGGEAARTLMGVPSARHGHESTLVRAAV